VTTWTVCKWIPKIIWPQLCFSAQGKQLHIPMEYLAEHESEFLMTKPYTTATILLLLWSCQIEKQSLYLFVEYIKAKGTPCCVGHPVHMHINIGNWIRVWLWCVIVLNRGRRQRFKSFWQMSFGLHGCVATVAKLKRETWKIAQSTLNNPIYYWSPTLPAHTLN
jgi:hypothetical protein